MVPFLQERGVVRLSWYSDTIPHSTADIFFDQQPLPIPVMSHNRMETSPPLSLLHRRFLMLRRQSV